jgi:NADH-quinone oxidoreductase subunit N
MAALYYLLVYAVTSLGVFAVLGVVSVEAADAAPADSQRLDASNLDDLRGLAHRRPALAAALTILLASLAGLPPTAGFLAKWYVFQAAVGSNLTWLAVVVVVTSIVAAFTYLRPMAYMYFASHQDEEGAHASVPLSGAVAVAVPALAVALAIVIGAPLARAARDASLPWQLSAPPPSAPSDRDAQQGPGIMFTAPAFEKKPAEEP